MGITGARWSPDGAEVILKLRAVVINGDLDDYMNYYKNRYRNQIHLARYDPDSIPALGLTASPEHPAMTHPSKKRTPGWPSLWSCDRLITTTILGNGKAILPFI